MENHYTMEQILRALPPQKARMFACDCADHILPYAGDPKLEEFVRIVRQTAQQNEETEFTQEWQKKWKTSAPYKTPWSYIHRGPKGASVRTSVKDAAFSTVKKVAWDAARHAAWAARRATAGAADRTRTDWWENAIRIEAKWQNQTLIKYLG